MSQYRKRPIAVDVEGPIAEARIVQSLEGPIPAAAGYYIITGPAEDSWPVHPDIFLATYERISDE
jgi:hypothetical protein